MKRKLIKQGLGGLTIYLPKKWADKKGLKEGDEVEVTEKDTLLLVQTSVQARKETTIQITKENYNNILVLLSHAYRQGFDSITLEGMGNAQIKELQKLVPTLLIGFEVTKKTSDSCVLENLSEPTGQKFDVIVKRLYLIIEESLSIIEKDSAEKSWKNKQEIEDMRQNLDRFILFCRRILIKEYEEQNPVLNWELLTFLMHIYHTIYYLYLHLEKTKPKLEKRTIVLMGELKKYFSLFDQAYFKKDLEAVDMINHQKAKYQFGECLAALASSKNNESIVLSYIREVFRLIQIGTSPILSQILEKQNS